MKVPAGSAASRFVTLPSPSRIPPNIPIQKNGALRPGFIIPGGFEAIEPEGDIADGGLAFGHVKFPPAIGGTEQIAEIAASLGLLNDQGPERSGMLCSTQAAWSSLRSLVAMVRGVSLIPTSLHLAQKSS